MVLDIVPIMLFQFAFLWLYGRHAAGLSGVVVGAMLAVYVASGLAAEIASTSYGALFRVGVPVRSVESANALCEAIKSAGGGCYVSQL